MKEGFQKITNGILALAISTGAGACAPIPAKSMEKISRPAISTPSTGTTASDLVVLSTETPSSTPTLLPTDTATTAEAAAAAVEPTIEATSTATPTRTPTETPRPTASATSTPKPTETATPTNLPPTVEPTRAPTKLPTSTPKPIPTATVEVKLTQSVGIPEAIAKVPPFSGQFDQDSFPNSNYFREYINTEPGKGIHVWGGTYAGGAFVDQQNQVHLFINISPDGKDVREVILPPQNTIFKTTQVKQGQRNIYQTANPHEMVAIMSSPNWIKSDGIQRLTIGIATDSPAHGNPPYNFINVYRRTFQNW